jgi:hypothetical protein
LGKRRRDGDEIESDESDVPEDVRKIPMPRDTPPPIPKEVLDRWYQKRRDRSGYTGRQGTNANNTPLGENSRIRQGSASGEEIVDLTPKPMVEVKTVYESAPIIRDLKKEAVSAFIPAAVRLKMEKAKGKGGLVEPEEADRLEKEGYLGRSSRDGESKSDVVPPRDPRAVMMEEVEDEDD